MSECEVREGGREDVEKAREQRGRENEGEKIREEKERRVRLKHVCCREERKMGEMK